MTFVFFMRHVYSRWLQDYCMLVASGVVVALNCVVLWRHFRRHLTTTYYGMLFMLMVTNVVYGIMNTVISTIMVLPASVKGFLFDGSDKALHLMSLTPHIAQQMVSLSGVFLALDRILILAVGTKYAFWNVSLKLSICAGITNTVTVLVFYCLICIPKEIPDLSTPQYVFKTFIFTPTLIAEVVLYAIFLFLYRNYSKTTKKPKEQTAANNRIFIFQMILNIALCVTPNALTAVRKINHHWAAFRWAGNIEPFYNVFFAAFVLLVSFFSLYFLRSKKKVVKIASALNNGFGTPRSTPRST